jgi:hypothetical protein
MSPRTPSSTAHVRSAHKYPSSPLPHATLQISTDLQLPAEAVTETFAMLAKRWAGKTYTAAAAESAIEVDPAGASRITRSAADDFGPGKKLTSTFLIKDSA